MAENGYIDKRECNEEMDSLDTQVQSLHRAIYVGDGKDDPPIVTRLDRIEQSLATLNQVKWLLLAAIFMMIGNIISQHFHL